MLPTDPLDHRLGNDGVRVRRRTRPGVSIWSRWPNGVRTMRVLSGEQVLVRVFIGESDKWHHRPLTTALLERLRKDGFAGATVFHGVAGFGARSVLHTAHLLRLSEDLPVVIEIVDSEEQLGRLLPILDEMVNEGLVTVEKVRVLKYAAGTRPPSPPSPAESMP